MTRKGMPKFGKEHLGEGFWVMGELVDYFEGVDFCGGDDERRPGRGVG